MKKNIFVVLFVLCAGVILANDWRVISYISDISGTSVFLGNVKSGNYLQVIISADATPIYFRDCLGNEIKNTKNKKTGETENIFTDAPAKLKAELWEAISEYLKYRK